MLLHLFIDKLLNLILHLSEELMRLLQLAHLA